MRRAGGAAFVLLAAFAAAAAPEPDADVAALESLRARIAQLQSDVASRRRELGSAAGELADIDAALADSARRLGEIDHRLAGHIGRLHDLEAERDARAADVAGARATLARLLRARHALGRNDRLRLLLSAGDPATAERLLAYHGYHTRAQALAVALQSDRLRELAGLTRAIRLETDALTRVRAAAETELVAVERRRDERLAVIAELEQEVAGADATLEALRDDEARLARLLDDLARTASAPRPAPAPAAAGAGAPDGPAGVFRTLHGRLEWPVQGRISRRFGARRGGGGEWRGVLLQADAGAPVQAVSDGRVVFAGDFGHLSLLIIIDHGEGYLSLYGHNAVLNKAVGDRVAARETIAALGGSRAQPALYFEIRKDGTPQDPARWCGRDRS